MIFARSKSLLLLLDPICLNNTWSLRYTTKSDVHKSTVKRSDSYKFDVNEQIAKHRHITSTRKHGVYYTNASAKPTNRFKRQSNILDENKPLSHKGYLHNQGYYKRQFEQLIAANKAKSAFHLCRQDMIQSDWVRPDFECFQILLKGLSKKGMLYECFDIFKQMCQRGFIQYDSSECSFIFTYLFQACMYSKDSTEALRRITDLRRLLKLKNVSMHIVTLHAMIAAYGRHDNMLLALNAVDEALEAKTLTNDQMRCIFNALLSGCCSNRKYGFVMAIELLKLSKELAINLKQLELNLILRIIRDCDLVQISDGDHVDDKIRSSTEALPSSFNKVDAFLSSMVNNNPRIYQDKHFPSNDTDLKYIQQKYFTTRHVTTSKPNQHDVNRLAILGGISALRIMLSSYLQGMQADIRTFHLILQLIPIDDDNSENELIEWMLQSDITVDVDFLNYQLLRAVKRKDQSRIKELLNRINREFNGPTHRTFRYLAISCERYNQASILIASMKKKKQIPIDNNTEAILLENAVRLADRLLILNCEQISEPAMDEVISYFLMIFDSSKGLSSQTTAILNSFLESRKSMLVKLERQKSSDSQKKRTMLDNFHYLFKTIENRIKIYNELN